MRRRGSPKADVFTAALVVAALLMVSGWWYAASAQSSALEAVELMQECQQLAHRITAARGGPKKADEATRAEGDLTQQIEQWCLSAGVAAKEILRIEPLPPSRVGDSSYVEQGARVELRRATLPQLASMVALIEESDSRLSAGNLRLSAPRTGTEQPEAPEAWQSEFTLTYYVYSPKSSRRVR